MHLGAYVDAAAEVARYIFLAEQGGLRGEGSREDGNPCGRIWRVTRGL